MASRATRRAVLAFIALADAPTPYRIVFREYRRDRAMRYYLTVDCETEGESLHTWARLFGLGQDRYSSQPFRPEGAETTKTIQDYNGTWRGWSVNVHALTDPGPNGLDVATRANLRQAATEEEEDPDGA